MLDKGLLPTSPCYPIRKVCFSPIKHWLAIALFMLTLIGCSTTPEQVTQSEPVVRKTTPSLSAEPIVDIDQKDVIFAQSALKAIGYNIGTVDGLWGPRSAKAIREFESSQNIKSADGFLSQLNLNRLASVSNLDPATISAESIQRPKIQTISSKLIEKPLSIGPQLIIVEQDYEVFTTPNPFSEKAYNLTAGTGIYVLEENAGWYKVELINRKQGFIQVD